MVKAVSEKMAHSGVSDHLQSDKKIGIGELQRLIADSLVLPPNLIVCGRISAIDGNKLTLSDAFGQVEGWLVDHAFELVQVGVFGFVELALLPSASFKALEFNRVVSYQPPALSAGASLEVASFQGQRAQHLKARQTALKAVRQFFEEEDFLELQTPTFSACPGLDSHVQSLGEVKRLDGLGGFLMTSPEFHMKRALVGGLPKIDQVARVFRAEELGPIHEPEFTLVEWYRAFAGSTEVMADTEAIVRRVFGALGPLPPELKGKFQCRTIKQLFAEFAGVEDAITLAEESEDSYFQIWVDRIEPALSKLTSPLFITEHPACFGGLARPLSDPRVLDRFELIFRGVELCNGFGELTCPVEQTKRFKNELRRRQLNSEPAYPLPQRFLQALHEGMPPAGGNALGFDRLIMLALGESTIASTMAFPDTSR